MATREQLKSGYLYLKDLLDEDIHAGDVWEGIPQRFDEDKAEYRRSARGARTLLKMMRQHVSQGKRNVKAKRGRT